MSVRRALRVLLSAAIAEGAELTRQRPAGSKPSFASPPQGARLSGYFPLPANSRNPPSTIAPTPAQTGTLTVC